ncbi:MAG: M64 family metallo-endopeptidase, partial [Firmicutes bacterium]|nr:M64 family metallo-endopeptidase [Bacillota bacterium]
MNKSKRVLIAGLLTLALIFSSGMMPFNRETSFQVADAHEFLKFCLDCNCDKKCNCDSKHNCNQVETYIVDNNNEIEQSIDIRNGYTIEDIRELLGQQSLYKSVRMHTPYDGVVTYQISMEDSEVESILQTASDIAPMNAFTYRRERIHGAGRPLSSSITVVLMGDGFTQAQQTAFMNHARSARDFMLDMHPFRLFRDIFVIYAVQTISSQTWVRTPDNTTNRFRSFEPTRNCPVSIRHLDISIPQWGRGQIYQVADWAVGGRANLNMVQVIANTTRFGGSAFHHPGITNLEVGISITTLHTSSGGWRKTFVHEFGHSFGGLADERNDVVGREAPNMTRDRNNPRWSHWIGHAGIGEPFHINDGDGRRWYVSRGFDRNFFGIVTDGCIMALSSSNIDSFCAVCSAELTRRMAHIARETFQSRHPNPMTINPPRNTHVVIPDGATRILAYAFNGNTYLQHITIPSTVTSIGRYAFIGATNLRTIVNNSRMPQLLGNWIMGSASTHFAGLNRSRITVYIPEGTRSLYEMRGWVGFNLVERGALFDGRGEIDSAVVQSILDKLNHDNTRVIDRNTSFQLFPSVGTGHPLNLSRLRWRVVDVDSANDRITIWAAGAYRNSRFNALESGVMPPYSRSELRNNLLTDWGGVTSSIPRINNYILRHGSSLVGANANDPIWIPSDEEIRLDWGLGNTGYAQYRRFQMNEFNERAWTRTIRSAGYANQKWTIPYDGGTRLWVTGTTQRAVRPALHLSLSALQEAVNRVPLFDTNGTLNPLALTRLQTAIAQTNRTAQFRLFPDIGTGHT